MRIIAFLLDPPVIRKILDHLAERTDRTRAPPVAPGVATAAS
jgi:predicted transcriptional regulator